MSTRQKSVFTIVAIVINISMMATVFADPHKREAEIKTKDAYSPPSAPLVLEKGAELASELLVLLGATVDSEIQFEGRITCFGRWAFFGGEAVGESGKPVSDGDAAALWLHTAYGWVLVDSYLDITDAGHFEDWMENYGCPRRLFFRD